MSDSTQSTNVDALDTETARMGQAQTELLELLTELARKHQELDVEYAPRVNALLREIQAKYSNIQTLAEVVRAAILPKDKKSAKRLTGAHAWRSTTTVEYDEDEAALVKRIQALGPRFRNKLLRTVPSRVLDKNACKLSVNENLITEVEGITVHKGESYAVTPNGGFTMTSSRDVTKLEGLPLPAILEAILRDPEL
jgi:phage host-nuclease inhibitor protein Gam